MQDFLQHSPEPPKPDEQTNQLVATTSNTLKEISELKNEIIKLTSSLRTLKGLSSDDSPRQSKHFNSKFTKDYKEDVKEQDLEESLAADKSMENKWWKLHH